MIRMILALIASLAMYGCASVQSPLDDGYQLGDLGDLRAQYCANAEPHRRAVILALMYQAGVRIPPSGACSSIFEVIDPASLPRIDVESAREDRRRFRERADASGDPASSADLPRTE